MDFIRDFSTPTISITQKTKNKKKRVAERLKVQGFGVTDGWESDFEEGNPKFRGLFGASGGRHWDSPRAPSLSMEEVRIYFPLVFVVCMKLENPWV